uniref:Uncharacterized protein n=1 Tax=Romanomermis culicivorax TaxID=13658 RepID=A0A915L909_ROMCU
MAACKYKMETNAKGSWTWHPIFIFMVVVGHRQGMSVGWISSIAPLHWLSTFRLLHSIWWWVHVVAQHWEIACFDIHNTIWQSGLFSCQSLHLFHRLLHHECLGSNGRGEG